MLKNNIEKIRHQKGDIEVRPIINPDTKYWYAEYKIIEDYPEGTRFRGFTGKKEFSNQKDCVDYYKKLAIIDIEND